MNTWKNLKVRTKLMVLVATSCLALTIVGAMGLAGMKKAHWSLDESNQTAEHIAMLGEMKSDFLAMRLDLVYMLALKDKEKLQGKWTDFAAKTAAVRDSIKKFEGTQLDTAEKEGIGVFKDGFEKYVTSGTKMGEMIIAAHAANDEKALAAALAFGTEQVAPLYAKPAETVASLVAKNIKDSQDMFKEDSVTLNRSLIVTIALILATLVSAIALGLFIARSVANPLRQVFDAMQQLATGDLSARCPVKSRDEMGMLSKEVNIMAEKLQQTISQVAHNGLEVAAAASQLRATSGQIATGAEELAAQTQTVATASEEMSATSTDIAVNCHQAADNANKVNQAAILSSEIVQHTITVMNQIAGRVKESAHMVETLGARSEEIGEIIGTIEDIADQTNLLALNAAIEAARAGEQGRGFAVVADEVRALAERTTKATKQISETIKTIQQETRNAVVAMDEGVKDVEMGTGEAAKSGEALNGILDQISTLSMQVSQIATAAEEQTATTGEITNNIQLITSVVEMTANGSNESAIAAAQLARLSEELRALMEQFKLAA